MHYTLHLLYSLPDMSPIVDTGEADGSRSADTPPTGTDMGNFERAFGDTERAADSTVKSAAALVTLARQLQKAAKEGNISSIKRSQGRLNDALDVLRQTVANALQSWPFQDGEEEQYLKDGFAEELRHIASERGVTIRERDGRLVSHPSIVRILPSDRAVRIDKKKVSTIRPSHLAGILIDNQEKPGRYPAGRFLEALYRVYSELVREDSSGRLMKAGPGRVVPLARIYKLFTSLPGIEREYAPMDFARDLYQLDTSGVTKTRSGASVFFHASTGTRSDRDVFTFVGPDGQDVKYYGVRFAEVS